MPPVDGRTPTTHLELPKPMPQHAVDSPFRTEQTCAGPTESAVAALGSSTSMGSVGQGHSRSNVCGGGPDSQPQMFMTLSEQMVAVSTAPTCPRWPLPQQKTRPSSLRAHAWSSPRPTSTKLTPAHSQGGCGSGGPSAPPVPPEPPVSVPPAPLPPPVPAFPPLAPPPPADATELPAAGSPLVQPPRLVASATANAAPVERKRRNIISSRSSTQSECEKQ